MSNMVRCKSGYLVTKTHQNIMIMVLFLLGVGLVSAGLLLTFLMVSVIISTSDILLMWRATCVPVALTGITVALCSYWPFMSSIEEYKSAYGKN